MTKLNRFKLRGLPTVTFIILLILVTGCGKVKVVPEISGSVYDENLLELTEKNLSNHLFKHNDELILISKEGKIFRWNPEKNIINFLYNINRDINPDARPFHRDDFLLLELKPSLTRLNKKEKQFMVFNLLSMKETALLENLDAVNVLGISDQLLTFQNSKNQVIFYNYLSRAEVKQVQLEKDETLFNSVYNKSNIYVLTRDRLITFSTGTAALSFLPLKNKAGGPFLLDGTSIYYGSIERRLIKQSVASKNVRWRFQIADVLRDAPVKIGPYIVIIPQDNNIYFFNKNGTMHWWVALGSTKMSEPVTMNRNAVVYLWNNQVKFFDYKEKKCVTYPLKDWVSLKSSLTVINEYIFFLHGDKREEEILDWNKPYYRQLSRIGNNYGVEVRTLPAYIFPRGKSIKFNLISINLIKPQYHIKIYKTLPGGAVDQPVFEKELLKDTEKANFFWIPEETAVYRMVIHINALNKKDVVVEETIETLDINKILKHYYYNLHLQSGASGWD